MLAAAWPLLLAATAAAPLPSPRQLAWHELETIGMVNFSTITYYGKEWGYGDEDPARFNPVDFDARQIVAAAKAGGLRGLVIDAKHHGGFCLWPSAYTDYSVKSSPWRGGRGDMVKELADACREAGLGFGFYLSPWDRHHADYGRPAYVEYYHNQLRELLTHYGPVFEVWFDGANGGDGWYGGARERRSIGPDYYQWAKVMALVRELQPGAVCFGREDVRWVGNEAGHAPAPCWATVTRGGSTWYPAEADFPLRAGWFWHPGARTRTSADLVDRYFATVGHNACMDIGLAPDRRGLLDAPDTAALQGFGDRLRAIFATDLAATARRDGLTLDFGRPTEFSVVSLREDLKFGERVDDWALEAQQAGEWREFARGVGIGNRRLWRGQPLTADKLRLRLLKSSAEPALREFAVYLEPESSRREARFATTAETGLAKTGWTIVSASCEGSPATNAIDGEPGTLWHTHTAAGRVPPPHHLVLDLGATHTLTGLLYLPRQDQCTVGNIDRYAVYVSADGQTWGEPAAAGEFANIKANPVQQKVVFARPASGRFVKFVALHSADGECICVAELGVTVK